MTELLWTSSQWVFLRSATTANDLRNPIKRCIDDLPCAAWFECFNRNRYDEGDHIIFIGEVEHCERSEALPLVYHAGGYDLTPNLQK